MKMLLVHAQDVASRLLKSFSFSNFYVPQPMPSRTQPMFLPCTRPIIQGSMIHAKKVIESTEHKIQLKGASCGGEVKEGQWCGALTACCTCAPHAFLCVRVRVWCVVSVMAVVYSLELEYTGATNSGDFLVEVEGSDFYGGVCNSKRQKKQISAKVNVDKNGKGKKITVRAAWATDRVQVYQPVRLLAKRSHANRTKTHLNYSARDIGSDLTHAGQNDLTVTRPGQDKAACDMRRRPYGNLANLIPYVSSCKLCFSSGRFRIRSRSPPTARTRSLKTRERS